MIAQNNKLLSGQVYMVTSDGWVGHIKIFLYGDVWQEDSKEFS